MPRNTLVREPGRLTREEANRALRLPDRMHMPIWESLEPGTRDAAFYKAIVALGRESEKKAA